MITILYLVSSVTISIFAHLYFDYTNFKPGIVPYLVFYWAYLAFVYFNRKKFNSKKNINYYLLILASIPLIGSEPLFENDHLRYQWEGKVVSKGYDPYQYAPADGKLKHIQFEKKDQIGFPSISSIYPPVAQVYFSLFGRLIYKTSLIGFQLINLFLVLGIIFYLQNKSVPLWKIALFFPYLQKEFINSIHIDLLMAVFILIAYELKNRNSFSKLAFSFSFLTKITSLILYPFLFLKKITLKNILLLLPLFLICIWTMFPHGQVGLIQFSKHWLWAPGMPSLFTELLNLTINSAKTLSLIFFLLIFTGIYIKFWLEKLNQEMAITYVLINLFFFVPVLNTWYTVLILPFALLTGNIPAMLYVLFSTNSYLQWNMPNQLFVTGMVHIPYVYFLYVIWQKRKVK
ncbi:hypothetical protein N9N67_11565 [Bacteriovoracaceae bacterium]|nr:hypothetical protein [Bacteriovoracaceae bacterium]